MKKQPPFFPTFPTQSILIISISLDERKIQKSCFLVIVNVNGKHFRQIKKINIEPCLPIVHCGNSFWQMAGEEWVEKV